MLAARTSTLDPRGGSRHEDRIAGALARDALRRPGAHPLEIQSSAPRRQPTQRVSCAARIRRQHQSGLRLHAGRCGRRSSVAGCGLSVGCRRPTVARDATTAAGGSGSAAPVGVHRTVTHRGQRGRRRARGRCTGGAVGITAGAEWRPAIVEELTATTIVPPGLVGHARSTSRNLISHPRSELST